MSTETQEIRKAGVVGCGLMGAGIAELCARRGLDTLVHEVTDAAVKAGRGRIDASMDRAVRRGRMTEQERDEARARLTFTTDLEDFVDRDVALEAVPESEELKTGLFRELDRIMKHPEALFGSNTSSIPLMTLAAATSRPGRVVGVHFFNPVPVMDLVELVPTLEVDDVAWTRVYRFVTDTLGRHAIVSQDRAGFVVNQLLIPYLLSAIRMFESGFATAPDIDAGMVRGCGHPMGPLALADHIGLDTTLAVAESLYEEFREPQFAPPALLSRMVKARRLGRKAGLGFYSYPGPAGTPVATAREARTTRPA